MNKREFIEGVGATCKNWAWSWSYINESEKIIIFGAWKDHTVGDTSMILSHEWKFNDKARRNAGFSQAEEHIRLVLEEGYTLKIFYMIADEKKDGDEPGPAKIKEFETILRPRKLLYINDRWFAVEVNVSMVLANELKNLIQS